MNNAKLKKMFHEATQLSPFQIEVCRHIYGLTQPFPCIELQLDELPDLCKYIYPENPSLIETTVLNLIKNKGKHVVYRGELIMKGER